MPNDFERRLAAAFEALPGSSAEAKRAARSAALASAAGRGSAATRSAIRFPGLGLRVLLAAALLLGGGIALARSLSGSEEAIRQSGGNWANNELPHVLGRSPGALEFPPGTSYAEAATQIFVAQERKRARKDIKLVAPLPRGKVALLPTQTGASLVVDLAAPFGYDPSTKQVMHAQVHVNAPDGREAIARHGHWPPGSWLAIPILPRCEIIHSEHDPGTRCEKGDTVGAHFDKRVGPYLPE